MPAVIHPVILDQAHWAQLEQVQMQVDRQVTYVSDMERFGVPDWWEPAVDRGDCEDIVLAKRKRLVEMGWPVDLLRIAAVIDGHGQLHAVLTVDVTSQAGKPATYVLDSHFEHVEPWAQLNAYGYKWLERSKPGSDHWARLDSGSGASTMQIAILALAVMPASPKWTDGGVPVVTPATIELTAYQPVIDELEPVAALAASGPLVLDTDGPQPHLAFTTTEVATNDEAPAEDHPAARHRGGRSAVRGRVQRVHDVRQGHGHSSVAS